MSTVLVINIKIYYEQHGAGQPLLLITGYGADHLALGQDTLAPPIHSDFMVSEIPNARLVEVKDHAHCFHLETPQEFVRIVTDFFG